MAIKNAEFYAGFPLKKKCKKVLQKECRLDSGHTFAHENKCWKCTYFLHFKSFKFFTGFESSIKFCVSNTNPALNSAFLSPVLII